MPICGIPCSLSLRQITPEVFGSSRLLPQKPYVLLRATLALNSLYWLIRSVRVFGNVHWLVYLTHWTFALQTVYYFLALGSATHLWANSGRKQREEDVSRGRGGRGLSGRRERSKGRKGVGGAVARSSFPSSSLASPSSSSTAALTVGAKGGDAAGDGERTALGCWRKLQWGLLFVCADCSIIVTGVYWTFLYNGWSDQLNLQIHLFNSLFMAVNVFIGASPFRWQHIGIAYIYGTLYLAFDILFYLCGSIFSYDDKVIYFFLDWGKTPGRAITTIAFLMLVALPLAHGFHVLIASGRERLRRMRPDWGWQGTDAEELERVMEVSGMRDADVWAPLTGEGDPNLYDSEEEEMGGASVFFVGGQEEKSRVVGRCGSFGSAALGGGGGEVGGGGRLVGKRALGGGGGVGGGNVPVHKAKIAVL